VDYREDREGDDGVRECDRIRGLGGSKKGSHQAAILGVFPTSCERPERRSLSIVPPPDWYSSEWSLHLLWVLTVVLNQLQAFQIIPSHYLAPSHYNSQYNTNAKLYHDIFGGNIMCSLIAFLPGHHVSVFSMNDILRVHGTN
jgi:hypothetical protein